MRQIVYLGQAGPIHKVGRSNDVERRMVELGIDSRFWVGHSTRLVRTFDCDDSRGLEGHLKALLWPWCYEFHHEWFILPDVLAQWLRGLPTWVSIPLALPIERPKKRVLTNLKD